MEMLPVSVQETELQNLFICSFAHDSVTIPLEKQTSSSETTNSPLLQKLIFAIKPQDAHICITEPSMHTHTRAEA